MHSLSHSVTNHHYARILKVIYLQARLFSRTVNLYIWLPNLLLHLFIRHFKFNVPNVRLKLNYSCFRQNMFLLQPYKYHWLHPSIFQFSEPKKKLNLFPFYFIANLLYSRLSIQNTSRIIWRFIITSSTTTQVWATTISCLDHYNSLLTELLAPTLALLSLFSTE